jgi:hypothetical protein
LAAAYATRSAKDEEPRFRLRPFEPKTYPPLTPEKFMAAFDKAQLAAEAGIADTPHPSQRRVHMEMPN